MSTPRQWLSYNRLTGVCQRLIKSQKPNGAPDVGLGAPQAIFMNRFLNAPNFVFFVWFCGADPLGRPGSDLLSHALRRSTIGAKGFHGRVRDGIGWSTLAKTTRSSKRISHWRCKFSIVLSVLKSLSPLGDLSIRMEVTFQAYRAISTG